MPSCFFFVVFIFCNHACVLSASYKFVFVYSYIFWLGPTPILSVTSPAFDFLGSYVIKAPLSTLVDNHNIVLWGHGDQ